MFAFLPKEMQDKQFEAIFKYKGETTYKLVWFVSFISILVVLDFLFVSGGIRRVAKRGIRPFFKKLGEWWEKEG